jgi:hypothetical protein
LSNHDTGAIPMKHPRSMLKTAAAPSHDKEKHAEKKTS